MANDVKRPLEFVDCPFCGEKAAVLEDGVRAEDEVPINRGGVTVFAAHVIFEGRDEPTVLMTRLCPNRSIEGPPGSPRTAQSSNVPPKFMDETMCQN